MEGLDEVDDDEQDDEDDEGDDDQDVHDQDVHDQDVHDQDVHDGRDDQEDELPSWSCRQRWRCGGDVYQR